MQVNSDVSTKFPYRTPSAGAFSNRRHYSNMNMSPKLTYQEMAHSSRDYDAERRRMALEIEQSRDTSALQSAHSRLQEQESTHEHMMAQFKN